MHVQVIKRNIRGYNWLSHAFRHHVCQNQSINFQGNFSSHKPTFISKYDLLKLFKQLKKDYKF